MKVTVTVPVKRNSLPKEVSFTRERGGDDEDRVQVYVPPADRTSSAVFEVDGMDLFGAVVQLMGEDRLREALSMTVLRQDQEDALMLSFGPNVTPEQALEQLKDAQEAILLAQVSAADELAEKVKPKPRGAKS